ncbi:MAG: hypothetical protein LBR17_08920, partial [Bacteroidales bacterium]|nr:hypothetical protein [Bacteroidales bacterium]
FLEINVQKPLEHDGTLWSNTFKGEKRKNQKKPVGVTLAMVYEGVASLLYRRLKFYFDFYTSKYGCILLKVEYSKM